MTGYAVVSKETSFGTVQIVLKTLNARSLEFNFRLPKFLEIREPVLRSHLSKVLERGTIFCQISIDNIPVDKSSGKLNLSVAKSYLSELLALAKELGIKNPDPMPLLNDLPDFFNSRQPDVSDEDFNVILQLLLIALNNLDQFRAKEGNEMEKNVDECIEKIERNFEKIKCLVPERAAQIKERLLTKLNSLSLTPVPDQNRLEQELIYYLEKIDINEECERLKNHLSYFSKICKEEENCGKKLGFLLQELNREITTLSNKSASAPIQQLAVLIKEDLEKVREMLMNVV